MHIYGLWMARFGEYSPGMQVFFMVSLATLSANFLALIFFYTIGFNDTAKVVLGTTCVTALVSAPLGGFLVGLNFKLKQVAAQLDLETRKDGLTGLSTRTEFYLQVQRRIQLSDPAKGAGAFLYIDADHFKRINDEYGHAIGDAVLQEIGISINSIIGEWDHAARFGGEEFAVFLEGSDLGKAKWISHGIPVGNTRHCRTVEG